MNYINNDFSLSKIRCMTPKESELDASLMNYIHIYKKINTKLHKYEF
jgi:hypothetical protein